MSKTLTYSIAAVLALTVGTTAIAHKNKGMMGHKMPSFEELDANQDGKLSKAEVVKYGEARFAAMDSNGDGNLSVDELMKDREEGAKRHVSRMIEKLDANADGSLSLDEMKNHRRGDRLNKMFDRLDKDEDGFISKAEMEEMRTRGKYGKKDDKSED